MALATCDLQTSARYPMALGFILILSAILITLKRIEIPTILITKLFTRTCASHPSYRFS
jgi:hypothetical protein